MPRTVFRTTTSTGTETTATTLHVEDGYNPPQHSNRILISVVAVLGYLGGKVDLATLVELAKLLLV